MSVLSDKTLKGRIAKKEVILGGNADGAKHCSYEFTAALMVRGGSGSVESIVEPGAPIEPAQLVWIRAREMISVPPNMVGLWIQTQTLARQGLLLLNISLVEPGYEGPLSAVFVNFGRKRVIVSPGTKIAKVMFLPLDGEALNQVGVSDSKLYDTGLVDTASNAPGSFLQLESFLPNIEEKAKAKLEAIDAEIKRSVDDIVRQTRSTLKEDLQSDLKGTLLKWGGGIAFGFVIGCALVWLWICTYLPRLAAQYSGVEELARKAAVIQQAETIGGLSKQIRDLTTELDSLKGQIGALKASEKTRQVPANTSRVAPLPDTDTGTSSQ